MPKTKKQIENFERDLKKEINANTEFGPNGEVIIKVSEKTIRRGEERNKVLEKKPNGGGRP